MYFCGVVKVCCAPVGQEKPLSNVVSEHQGPLQALVFHPRLGRGKPAEDIVPRLLDDCPEIEVILELLLVDDGLEEKLAVLSETFEEELG